MGIKRRHTTTKAKGLFGGSGGYAELPTRPFNNWDARARRQAIEEADSGNLMRAADLTEVCWTEDGVIGGLVDVRTLGLLGLPCSFSGPPEIAEALEGSDNKIGDWWRMFPESETAKLFGWGIMLGAGIAQRVKDPNRAIGQRDTPRLKTWHPRWLRKDLFDGSWWLMTTKGEIEITPGDGEWILYTPYGDSRPWAWGAWRAASLSYVMKRDAIFDRGRHSEVNAPVRVGKTPEGASEAKRNQFLLHLKKMQRDNCFVLPFEYEFNVVTTARDTSMIYDAIIEWADGEAQVKLSGQKVTTTGTTGFSSGNIHERISQSLIRFTAESGVTCLTDQALTHYSADNYSTTETAGVKYDIDPPEDKKKKAETIGAMGDSIGKMNSALKDVGMRLDPASVVPLVESMGLRAIPLEKTEPTDGLS